MTFGDYSNHDDLEQRTRLLIEIVVMIRGEGNKNGSQLVNRDMVKDEIKEFKIE